MPPVFKNIFIIDFEFIADSGEKSKPVCVVTHEIILGNTKKLWLEGNDPFTLKPPYPVGETDLFVAYFSSAEWGCHLTLNWPLPVQVVDLHPEFRKITNGLPGISKSLLGACQQYEIAAIAESEKESIRQRIMQEPPDTEEEKTHIMDYCTSDVMKTAKLFKKIASGNNFDIGTALFRGKYMEAIAIMEYNGIPIDIKTLTALK